MSGPLDDFFIDEDTVQVATGVEAYYRVTLTHNSKSTSIETTASVKCTSPDAVRVFGGGDTTPDGLLTALLVAAFDIGQLEAERRGKPLVDVQPLDGFSPMPPLSEIGE